jgi:signal transduction histidine kinase
MSNHLKPLDRDPTTSKRELASSALIDHLQTGAENQKAQLARELHDDLGGLLVGAAMDLAWAEKHVESPPAELKQKLARARQTLASAIDLKRKLIEELRPSLLDNVGLFAALRWHVQAMCDASSMLCKITLPQEERRFMPDVPIALFRIAQEALAVIASHGRATSAEFSVTINDQACSFSFISKSADASDSAVFEPNALAALRHRAAMLGGVLAYANVKSQGATITATFPSTIFQAAV